MIAGEFRCAFFARDYDASVAFYRTGLELPVIDTWDRGPNDRGTMFRASSGIIEVLAHPADPPADSVWDHRAPQGVTLVIEVDDVDKWHEHAISNGLTTQQGLTQQPWGHRSFVVADPDGVQLYVYTSGDHT